MTVIGFGLNHKIAPLALLERMSFNVGAMDSFLSELRSTEKIDEAFGLSTCNRTEFLLAVPSAPEALTTLLEHLQNVKGLDLRPDAEHTFFHAEDGAVRHIFKVACGIDSLVIGENEILGQLRRARETASDAGHIGEVLEPMLLRAIDVGRRARQSTAISRGNVSVASVAATLAERCLGELSNKQGLVLGAGETAEAAAFQLMERGVKNLTIANRTYDRGHQLALALGARQVAMEEVGETLFQADVVVCATGAPHYIITVPMAQAAMAARAQRPLLFLDVSVPRNIDPAVGEIDGVHVYSLEDLKQLAEENRAQREVEVLEVDALIEKELLAYQSTRLSGDTTRLVAALHRRVDQVRRDHITRHGHNFDGAHRDHLDMFSSGLTRSLLHDLVENLRSLDLNTDDGRHRFQIAQELFNVKPDERD